MEDIVQTWNAIIPNYQISGEDLQKVKPMFLMEAIFELFDMLGIDGDKIIRHQINPVDKDNFENLEAFSALIPVINLSGAINFLLENISPDVKKTTFYDLLTPAPQNTQNLLRILLNFITFVSELKDNIIIEENKIQESTYETEELYKKKDELMDKCHQAYQDDVDRDSRIKHLHSKIGHLKDEPEVLEKHYKDLDAKLKILKQQHESYITELNNDKIQHSTLSEEISRAEKCIVDESEEREAHSAKEEAVQREQEVAQSVKEAEALIFQKNEVVKTLEANTAHIVQSQKILNNLEKLYKVMGELKSTNNPNSAEEEERKSLELKKEELVNRINSFKTEEAQWQLKMDDSIEKVEKELQEVELFKKEVDDDCKNAAERISKMQNEAVVLQNKITEEDRECEKMLHLYTSTIPAQFDKMIESNISNIDSVLDDLKKFFNKNFL